MDYPFYLIKMVTETLFCCLRLLVGLLHQVRCRFLESRRQQPHYPITVVVGIWVTFYKILSSSKAQTVGLSTAHLELST